MPVPSDGCIRQHLFVFVMPTGSRSEYAFMVFSVHLGKVGLFCSRPPPLNRTTLGDGSMYVSDVSGLKLATQIRKLADNLRLDSSIPACYG